MIRTAVIFMLVIFSAVCGADAQVSPCPPLPNDRAWTSPEMYLASRDSVKKVLEWLCRTPLNFRIAERSEANAVVLIWIAGTPEPVLRIETSAMPFLAENEDLLYPVIHGMLRYQLGHAREVSTAKLHSEGLEVLAALAEQSDTLSRAGYLKPLLRAYRKGRLQRYVEENLSDSGHR